MGGRALKWLGADRRAWWCRLKPVQHHLACIVLHEAIRAEATVGSPVALFSADELAHVTGTNRTTVARNLTDLLQAGFCRIDTRRGRGARMLIAVVDVDRVGDFSGDLSGDFVPPDLETIPPTSTAGPPGGGDFSGDFPVPFRDPDILDLDQGSIRISDPRSETSGRTQTSREKTMGPTGADAIVPGVSVRGGALAELTLFAEAEANTPRSRARKGPDPAKIHPRAWAAADYMRAQILAQNAGAWISRQPWDVNSREGVRLKWAYEFDLIHRRDRKEWEEIARFTKRAYTAPAGGSRFVVESPSNLRDKWDRIHAAIDRERQPQQRPGVPADNRPPPQLKRWGSDGWDEPNNEPNEGSNG